MKKLLFALSALVLTATFTSCKKEHTCECTTTYDDDQFPAVTMSTTIKDSKKNAKSACDGKIVTVPGARMECKLK